MFFALMTWLAGAALVIAAVLVAYRSAPITSPDGRNTRMLFDLFGTERAALRRQVESLRRDNAVYIRSSCDHQKAAHAKAQQLADAEHLLKEAQANNDKLHDELEAALATMRAACADRDVARRHAADLAAERHQARIERDEARDAWEPGFAHQTTFFERLLCRSVVHCAG